MFGISTVTKIILQGLAALDALAGAPLAFGLGPRRSVSRI